MRAVFFVFMKRTAFAILWPLLFACLFFYSCGLRSKGAADALAGHWLILYPDHKLTSLHQREVYGHYQDSLVRLYGLKLITLDANGSFAEADSLQTAAKWMVWEDSLVKIREGGMGFNPFTTTYGGIQNDEALLVQYPRLENEKIKVVWHLKKIDEDEQVQALFSAEANAWRKKPTTPETLTAMRKRLASMLKYYAAYFALIGNEAIYFAPARIPLPFGYYQHAVHLRTKLPDAFVRLFYNEAAAAAARALLQQAVNAEGSAFQRDKNFVIEYGLFFKKLARWLDGKTVGD